MAAEHRTWNARLMGWTGYARVWRVAAVRQAILLGTLTRIAIFGMGVALTLHVVLSLGASYTQAGLASGVLTVAIGVASPYRGRLLDREEGGAPVVSSGLARSCPIWGCWR